MNIYELDIEKLILKEVRSKNIELIDSIGFHSDYNYERQVHIPNSGIADIVGTSYSFKEMIISYDVVELKRGAICIEALNQAVGYADGLLKNLSNGWHGLYEIKLIGAGVKHSQDLFDLIKSNCEYTIQIYDWSIDFNRGLNFDLLFAYSPDLLLNKELNSKIENTLNVS